VILITAIYN